jgi:hypothetical protein
MSDTHLKQSIFGDLCTSLAKIADAPAASENTRDMQSAKAAIEEIAIDLVKNLGFVSRAGAFAVLSGSTRILSELPELPGSRVILLSSGEWDNLLLRSDAAHIGLAFRKGLCFRDGINTLMARGANCTRYAEMLRQAAGIEGFIKELVPSNGNIWRASNAPLLAGLLTICATRDSAGATSEMAAALSRNDPLMSVGLLLAGAPIPDADRIPEKESLGQLLGNRMLSGHSRLGLMRLSGSLTDWIADPARQDALTASLRAEYHAARSA